MSDFTTSANRITAPQLIDSLSKLIPAREPVMIWGSPGIGKTSIMEQVAARFRETDPDYQLIPFIASLRDAVDLRGIPVADGNVTKWLTPAEFPRAGSGIIFCDEINTAPPLVQAAMYSLIHDARIGEYQIPEGFARVAAGNRDSDRGATHRMPAPLLDRFIQYELVVDVDAWCAWAIDHDIAVPIVAFMRWCPEALNDFDPKEQRFSTPRSWEKVSRVLTLELATEYQTIAGIIGDRLAAQFCAFLSMFRKLPNPDAILLHPDTADVPRDDIGTLNAIAALLARRADIQNFDRVMTYAERMPIEFAVLIVRDATQRDPSLMETSAFVRFVAAHSDLVL